MNVSEAKKGFSNQNEERLANYISWRFYFG